MVSQSFRTNRPLRSPGRTLKSEVYTLATLQGLDSGCRKSDCRFQSYRRTLLETKVINPEIAGVDAEGAEVEFHRQYG